MSDESPELAMRYYDRFSPVYDVLSSPRYYRKPREAAVEALRLGSGAVVLNVPCGTGQSFELLQDRLRGTGRVIGVDVSSGMLARADAKVRAHGWDNVDLVQEDVTVLDAEWAASLGVTEGYDAVLCDLGLSGFPSWQRVTDQLVSTLKPGGRLVVMDWFIPHTSLRGALIRWIGKGEVDRDLPGYLRGLLDAVEVDQSFKGGDMFVAAGVRPTD